MVGHDLYIIALVGAPHFGGHLPQPKGLLFPMRLQIDPSWFVCLTSVVISHIQTPQTNVLGTLLEDD